MAKMIGFAAIDLIIASLKAPLAERPNTTSAPSMASTSVRNLVLTACAAFHWFMPSLRPW